MANRKRKRNRRRRRSRNRHRARIYRRNRNPIARYNMPRRRSNRRYRRRRNQAVAGSLRNLSQLAKDAAAAIVGGVLTRSLPQ
ncbi:MAG: hypothetical protein L0212_03810, partial [Acidobacteria bacterium]|nr:hypothetical protein [Acidobacteriota bacterium]